MVPKEILSLQHPIVKEWVELRLDKEARERSHQVLLMGEKMIQELGAKGFLQTLITTKPAPTIPASECYLVTPEILKKITGIPAPDGFAAIAKLPEPQDLRGKQRLLILDRLSDPGNLGTLLRTALGLGWDGVVFTAGTVDPFNDKALRASKGALFSLPFCQKASGELGVLFHARTVYLADLEGTPLDSISPSPPLALILSNEAAGPAPWTEKNAEKIAIPMHNGVESLSVATSGAILLYKLSNL